MSLVDRANELEYVPEEQLIQMSQSPEGQYPQFLVLSEIQRRNQMRRMYKNQMAKMNQPTTTVAEESVMELAGQGAVPMMDSLSSLSSSEGGLRSMAPTLMKSGKKTEIEKDEAELSEELRELLAKDRRYAQQYKDYESRERFFPPLVPRNFIVSDDEYNRAKRSGAYMREGNLQDYRPFLALLGALSGESGPRYMPESKVKGLQAMVEATRKEKQMQQMGMQEGGITQMRSGGILGISGDSLSQSFINPMEQQQQEVDEGTLSKAVNWAKENPMDALNLAANATFFIPGLGVVAGAAIKGGLKAIPFIAKAATAAKRGLQKTYTVPNPALIRGPKGKNSFITGGPERVFSPSRTAAAGLPIAGAGYNLTMAGLGAFDSETTKPEEELTEAQKRAASSLKDLEKLLDKPTDTTTTQKQGFESDDFLTLAQLGGILGGATNLGEAAMGIGNLAGQIQKTRRESGLEGAQRSLLEAQAAKYIADVANMDLDNALQQYSAIPKLVESGVLTPEEAKIREAALIQRINEFQGTATNTSQKSYSQFVS